MRLIKLLGPTAALLPFCLQLQGCCNNAAIAEGSTSTAGTAATTAAATSSGSHTTAGATGTAVGTTSGAGTAAGTTSGGTTTAAATTVGAGTTSSGTTGTTSSSSSTTSGASPNNVRVANLIGDILTPLDLCVTPHGIPFTSSDVALIQGSSLGIAATGLARGQVSAYLPLAPGGYDVAITNGNEVGGCPIGYPSGGPIIIPNTGLVTLTMSGAITGSFSLSVTVFPDDPGTPLPASTQIRFIEALDGLNGVDLGGGFGSSFSAVATNVPYEGVAALNGADTNGYAPLPAGLSDFVTARQTGGQTLFVGTGLTVPSGGYGSVFLSGYFNDGAAFDSALEVCDDSAGPQPNGAFSCVPLASKALLRLVQLIPNAPPLDLCVTNLDAGIAQVAGLAGLAAGIDYPQVSAYVPVPANIGSNSYSNLIVIPAGGSCAGPPDGGLVNITGQILSAGSYNTVVAEGFIDGGFFSPVGLLLPKDETTAPPDVLEDGGVNVRFQNGASGYGVANLDLGTCSFSNVFLSNTFGTEPTEAIGETDDQAYTSFIPGTLTPPLLDAGLVVCNPGNQAPMVPEPGYYLPATQIHSTAISLFLIGLGTAGQPFTLMQVDDQAAPSGGLLPTH